MSKHVFKILNHYQRPWSRRYIHLFSRSSVRSPSNKRVVGTTRYCLRRFLWNFAKSTWCSDRNSISRPITGISSRYELSLNFANSTRISVPMYLHHKFYSFPERTRKCHWSRRFRNNPQTDSSVSNLFSNDKNYFNNQKSMCPPILNGVALSTSTK